MIEKFIPGLELTESFYHEIVHPILDRCFPGLNYSAGKLHRGSDVLGFDTLQSMDHDWSPTIIDLFLREDDCDQLKADIRRVLADELPHEFQGLPTNILTPEFDGGMIGFIEALYSKINSEAVLNLPRHVGGIAQYVDSTDILDRINRCKQLSVLYERNI